MVEECPHKMVLDVDMLGAWVVNRISGKFNASITFTVAIIQQHSMNDAVMLRLKWHRDWDHNQLGQLNLSSHYFTCNFTLFPLLVLRTSRKKFKLSSVEFHHTVLIKRPLRVWTSSFSLQQSLFSYGWREQRSGRETKTWNTRTHWSWCW